MRRVVYPLALVVAACASPAHAHHSIGAVYDSARQVTVEGVVAEFRFINPHPFLIIEVSAEGATVSWQLEMDNRFELSGIGMTAETLQPGDRVIASGSIGRARPQTLYLRRLERPSDGLLYEQRGATPTVSGGRG